MCSLRLHADYIVLCGTSGTSRAWTPISSVVVGRDEAVLVLTRAFAADVLRSGAGTGLAQPAAVKASAAFAFARAISEALLSPGKFAQPTFNNLLTCRPSPQLDRYRSGPGHVYSLGSATAH